MHRCMTIVFTLLVMGLLAGCGGSNSNNASFTTFTPFTSADESDVSGKIIYSTSARGYKAYRLETNGDAAWDGAENTDAVPNLGKVGQWTIDNGTLVITGAGEEHKFSRIQKIDMSPTNNTAYWLVSEEGKDSNGARTSTVTRFYYGEISEHAPRGNAQNYLNAITVSPGKVKLGGSIQGTDLALHTIDSQFNALSTIGVTTPESDSPGDFSNGDASTAKFYRPAGVTTDGTNVYVADSRNHCIRQIDLNGNVSTIAGSIAKSAGFHDGTGSDARFNRPMGITISGNYLYVADSENHAIRRINIGTKEVKTVAGTGSAGTQDSTDGKQATFYLPYGITTDGTNLYVADSYNHAIRRIVIATGAVSTIAGSPGNPDSTDATGSSARFNLPAYITTDGSYLYVTDANNKTIRRVEIATGAVSTLAGLAGTTGTQDGSRTQATFTLPIGITTDGRYLYVADGYWTSGYAGSIIRRVDKATGDVTTVAGEPNVTGSSNIGAGTFNGPTGITTDGTTLYVSDSYNNVIRTIEPSLP